MERNNQRLVAVLVGGYPLDPARIRGGVQAATAYLVQGLNRISALELHVLTFAPTGWDGPDFFNQEGVWVHLLPPYPRLERLLGYRRYQGTIERALGQILPDVVHAQEAGAEALIALRSPYPTVVTVHGIRAEDGKHARSLRKRLRFLLDSLLVERPAMRRVRHLIAISRYVTGYFAPLLRPDARVDYIPNAVDERFFHLDGAAYTRPVVLYAGRVTALKRVLDLVQAFAQVVRQVPGAELRIAGETASEPAYAEQVRQSIQQAGLGGQIRLLGELRQEDVLREYAACTLVALPSAQENSPMTLAQAMAAGKPVAATRVGGVPEMVGPNCERGLLAPPGDVDALAAAIIQLLCDQGLRASLGRQARAFALENYQVDRVARKTYEVYQNAVKMERSAHG